MTDATRAALQRIIRREARSLLQYVSDAFPWTSPEEKETLDGILELKAQQWKQVGQLMDYLARHGTQPPHLGTFPQSYTSANFISVDHLLRLLIAQQREAVARLDDDLARVSGPLAESLLHDSRQILEGLQRLQARQPAPAAS